MAVYALNLFDLADNDDYLGYSRGSVAAVGRYGGKVAALGKLTGEVIPGDAAPRQALVLVEWPDQAALDAYRADTENDELHTLRERGTERYLWWTFEKLDDLRPLLKDR